MIIIESDIGYNFPGEIIRRREADGLILAVAKHDSVTGGAYYSAHLCREYTHSSGRKHEQRLEWLSFRDASTRFESRDAAIAYAMEV